MVSIDNKLGNVGGLGNAQPLVRPRNTSTGDLGTQKGNQFSSLLTQKQTQTPVPKQTQQAQESLSTYSPLMLKYGSNRISEIKNIAEGYGVTDLSNEDFDYAIRYGRSIIADYLV